MGLVLEGEMWDALQDAIGRMMLRQVAAERAAIIATLRMLAEQEEALRGSLPDYDEAGTFRADALRDAADRLERGDG